MAKHIHITKRAEPVCDFCSGPGVTTRYPCSATVAIVALAEGDPTPSAVAESNDDWAACAACSALVATGDPARIAAGVLAKPSDPEVASALAIPEFRALALESLTNLYLKLIPVLGAPVPCTGFASDDEGQIIRIVEDDEPITLEERDDD